MIQISVPNEPTPMFRDHSKSAYCNPELVLSIDPGNCVFPCTCYGRVHQNSMLLGLKYKCPIWICIKASNLVIFKKSLQILIVIWSVECHVLVRVSRV